jgi:polysaccharide export outer membrane protein
LLGAAGCQTPQSPQLFADLTQQYEPKAVKPREQVTGALKPEEHEQQVVKPQEIVLHEGDVVRISFPGAPNLNTTQQIRRDGRIVLPLVGEFQAAGMAPSAMEKELLKLYGPQLQTKEVSVSVDSSAFPVYVVGAVLRPGKIMSDRPITALEAILEAGGFDNAKANMKKVTVLRHEAGRVDHYKLNLKGVLQGEDSEVFNLKPYDIIYVPERFSWF